MVFVAWNAKKTLFKKAAAVRFSKLIEIQTNNSYETNHEVSYIFYLSITPK